MAYTVEQCPTHHVVSSERTHKVVEEPSHSALFAGTLDQCRDWAFMMNVARHNREKTETKMVDPTQVVGWEY